MSVWERNGHGMVEDNALDDTTVEDVLAGRYQGDAPDLVAASRFVQQMRSFADLPAPPPSAALARILSDAAPVLDRHAPAAPPRRHGNRQDRHWWPPRHAETGRRAAPRLSLPAIAAATAAALVVVVLAVGYVQLLPGRTHTLLQQAVRAVTPFDFPEQTKPQAYSSRAPRPQTATPTAQPPQLAAGEPSKPRPDMGEGVPTIGRDATDDPSGPGSSNPAPRPMTSTSTTTLAPRAAPPVPPSNQPTSGVATTSSVPSPPSTPQRLSASLSSGKTGQRAGGTDGHASAVLDANPGKDRLCLTLVMSGGDRVTSVHLHEGSLEAGGRVVATFQPAPGPSSTCVVVPDRLLKTIRKDPSRYYLEVHTSQYPEGALRGQLTKQSR